jgi:hypothetical protein
MSSVEDRLKSIADKQRQTPEARGYVRAITEIIAWLRSDLADKPVPRSWTAIADELVPWLGDEERKP